MLLRKKEYVLCIEQLSQKQQQKLPTEIEIRFWQIQQFKSNNSPNPKVGLFFNLLNRRVAQKDVLGQQCEHFLTQKDVLGLTSSAQSITQFSRNLELRRFYF